MKKNTLQKLFTLLICIFSVFTMHEVIFAANAAIAVQGKSYEIPIGEQYLSNNLNQLDMLAYGKKTLGLMTISGDIGTEGIYNDTKAYSINDIVTFKYTYSGAYHPDNEIDWSIYPSDEKSVNGIELKKKIGDGVIIVQKSNDGVNWENAADPIYDAFEKSNLTGSKLYTTTNDEMMSGTYYRILIAYEMRRLMRTEGGFSVFGLTPNLFEEKKYDSRAFYEEYTFYLCNEKNYVLIKDIRDKSVHKSGDKVVSGFYIDNQGSNDKVTVKLDKGTANEAKQYDSFTSVGKYTVEVSSKIGKKRQQIIEVTEGMSMTEINPLVYEGEKNTGFPETNRITGNISAGIKSLTNIKITQKAGYTTTTSNYNGFDAYGINGDSASIFIRLNYPKALTNAGWEIVNDEYGKKEKELVLGVNTGEVGSGAVIIQTSPNGNNWVNVDKGKYSNGLFSTDFSNYYNAKEDVLLYTPSGTDINKGVYIRIYYVYQIKNAKAKKTVDCTEKYEFYLCSSSLGSVRFENLSLDSHAVEKQFGDANANDLNLYKNGETLPSDSCTFTGFRINKGNNLTVDISVEKDGDKCDIPANMEFKEEGRYVIHMTSDVGTSQDVTLYVDKSKDDNVFKRYFGENLLEGKRIYDENTYPVYEAGTLKYRLKQVPDKYLPLNGVIKNTTTGSEMHINSSREKREGSIIDPGIYEAKFYTGFESNTFAGDVRSYTFRFNVIPKGTAPGPRLNKERLYNEYAHSCASDSYPKYYAVSYQSATQGRNITLAFKDRESAKQYAYDYEKGAIVETNGKLVYTGTLMKGDESIRFEPEDGWKIVDAINAVTEKAVYERYFDLSDSSTYMTLKDSIIKNHKNLRQLELSRSIVVFGTEPEDQKEKLTDLDVLPFISAKPVAYINYGTNIKPIITTEDFKFTKDKYGCDSYKVKITDKNSDEYEIEYNKGVGEQLSEKDCPSGRVTITETTKWDDSVSYDAIYIKPNENTSTIDILYYDGGTEKYKSVTQANDGEKLNADAFTISGLTDELDPYSLIIITKDNDIIGTYAGDQVINGAWSDKGIYEIKVVNRLGYGYTYELEIRDSEYSTIVFEGDGTEDIKGLFTSFGEEDVSLPIIEKEGYTLEGYEDENGIIYKNKIDKIKFKGTMILTAKWKPIKIRIYVTDMDGNILSDERVDYGTIYTLGKVTAKDGFQFSGWQYNGEIYNESIEICTKEDIILTPVMTEISTGEISTSDLEVVSKNIEEKKRRTRSIIILIALILLVACIFIIRKFGKLIVSLRTEKR